MPSALSPHQNHFLGFHQLSRLQPKKINSTRQAIRLPLNLMLACTLLAVKECGDFLSGEIEDSDSSAVGHCTNTFDLNPTVVIAVVGIEPIFEGRTETPIYNQDVNVTIVIEISKLLLIQS